MYAVIEDSGRQFRVAEGDVIEVDLRELPADASQVEFDRVLLVRGDDQVQVGTPLVEGAKVVADILQAEMKGPKLHHYVLRRRKASRRKTGHRQRYLQVRVSRIVA